MRGPFPSVKAGAAAGAVRAMIAGPEKPGKPRLPRQRFWFPGSEREKKSENPSVAFVRMRSRGIWASSERCNGDFRTPVFAPLVRFSIFSHALRLGTHYREAPPRFGLARQSLANSPFQGRAWEREIFSL